MILDDAKNMMLGDRQIERVYRGAEIVWESSRNIFDENSPWAIPASCSVNTGAFNTLGDPKLTFWFSCKPNTTYRITWEQSGDRFCVYGTDTELLSPPSNWDRASTVYRATTAAYPVSGYYEFTTNYTNKMIYVYLALNTRPNGVVIKQV